LEEKHFKLLDQMQQAKQIAVVRESNHLNGDSVKNVRHISGTQYSKINEMHFLYYIYDELTTPTMFRALLAQLQEALHKQRLVYCMLVMSVGCTSNGVSLQTLCSQQT
jgi:hypothetical protein